MHDAAGQGQPTARRRIAAITSPADATVDAAQRSEQRLEGLIGRLPQSLQRSIRWLRRRSSLWARIPAGVLLIGGGLLSILPGFGLWMLPLGVLLLAEDIPPLRRGRDRALDWIERRRPHWIRRSGA
jgi:hypothetical protein